ncbi:RNA polymerase sigma factor [Pseudofrankia sp. DC12]|uniref:RNA polymerase sigma factor n=1 Tax=Pseudofrankia sp. DC12 TaxID=683315 RepID=UPI000A01CE82|nr:RNA polymerase sigma factor [Pseudofrankia sp. DC12]
MSSESISDSDDDLLARVAAGDGGAAFGCLFRKHSTAVYSYCFHRLGSWSAAEDATSVVFLEAWRRRADAVVVSGSLRPWLLGVATNVMRNQHRAARRYDAALRRLPPPETQPDPSDDVAGRIDDERQMAAVLGELKALKRNELEVIMVVAVEGLTYAEASVSLGIPVGTVRSRLARARARLAARRPSVVSEGGGEPVVSARVGRDRG